MKKIMYIHNALALKGGIERVFADKMNMLVQSGEYDVWMVTYDQGQHPLAFSLDRRVHYVDLDIRTHVQYQYRGLRRLWERYRLNRLLRVHMKALLREVEPDIIITTTAGLLSLLDKLRGKTPLIVESHASYEHLIDYAYMNILHRFDIRQRCCLLHRVNVIVTLTETDACRWRNAGYRNVVVIPNIVHFNDPGSSSYCLQKNVLFVGRNAVQKDIPSLLEVWRRVYEQHPEWTLHIYGDGFHEGDLNDEAGVSVHNPVDDIFVKYRACAMLLLTSIWEPFGLVIPEAMSCGLPVVSFEGDGPCDIITDGVDGFIVKDRNIEAFANRVCQLMEDTELRKHMGQTAIFSVQRYSVEHIMPMWQELFESLKK